MCRIESKTYHHPDGTVETSERTIRCPDAPAMSVCAQVERREIESARLVEMRPSSSQSSATKASRPSSSSSGRAKTKIEVVRRPSKKHSKRHSESSVQLPTPVSNYSLGNTRVPPPAPTPPPTGVEMPTPGDNTWEANTTYVRHVQPEDAATYRTYSRPHSGVFTIEEVVPERFGPSSISSTTAERASILATARPRPGLEVDTSRGSSGSRSPALSSPGLSSIQRLNIRHDSAQGSPPASNLFNKPRRPRAGSSNLHSPRTGSTSSGSRERQHRDPEYRPITPVDRPSPERVLSHNSADDVLEAERRQMENERAETRARNRRSADLAGSASPRSETTTSRRAIEGSTRRYSVVVHNPSSIGRGNSVHNTGEDVIAQQQARAEKRRSRGSERRSSPRSDEAVREDSSEASNSGEHGQRRRH